MSFVNRVKNDQNAKALTVLTGAAGQVGAGNTIALNNVQPGSLTAKITMAVKTSTLTMTPSWQVSRDGTTWLDLKAMNNAAQVASAAGTGSTVSTTIVVPLQLALPYLYARAIVTTAVGVADGVADAFAVSYSWLEPDFS